MASGLFVVLYMFRWSASRRWYSGNGALRILWAFLVSFRLLQFEWLQWCQISKLHALLSSLRRYHIGYTNNEYSLQFDIYSILNILSYLSYAIYPILRILSCLVLSCAIISDSSYHVFLWTDSISTSNIPPPIISTTDDTDTDCSTNKKRRRRRRKKKTFEQTDDMLQDMGANMESFAKKTLSDDHVILPKRRKLNRQIEPITNEANQSTTTVSTVCYPTNTTATKTTNCIEPTPYAVVPGDNQTAPTVQAIHYNISSECT